MGSLFKSRTVRQEHPEAKAAVDQQQKYVSQFTDNPAYKYHTDQLGYINSGDYGRLSSVQALNNEAAKADRTNKYHFATGAAAFNANPLLQQAMRNKQQATTQENFALQMPGVIQDQADSSSQFTQNALYNAASGQSNVAQGYQNAIKYTFKKPLFGSILGAAAPFLSFIPGVGPALAAGASAVSGAMNGGQQGGDIFGAAGGGSWNPQGFSFSRSRKPSSDPMASVQAGKNQDELFNMAPDAGELSGQQQASNNLNADTPFKRFRSPFLT